MEETLCSYASKIERHLDRNMQLEKYLQGFGKSPALRHPRSR